MLIKQYGRSGRVCKVTFKLPPDVATKTAALCGDFNEWDPQRGFMERSMDGGFALTLLLHVGRRYRFGYVIDGKWQVEAQADGLDTSHEVHDEASVLLL